MNPITTIMQNAAERAAEHILQEVRALSGWESIFDEDENINVPDNERELLVFLCGDRKITDDRPDDADWGLAEGYWDIEKQYWRVRGTPNSYVTHWREQPVPPETAQ